MPDFHIIFKPAIKDHLEGRPKNGMFIALPSNLKGNVEDISPNNSRIQAILLETESKNIMIVNVLPKRSENN